MIKNLFIFVLLLLSAPIFAQSFYLDNPHEQSFQMMIRYKENGQWTERFDEIGPGEEHFLLAESEDGVLYLYLQSGIGHYLMGEDLWMAIGDSGVRFPFKKFSSDNGEDFTYVINSDDFSYYAANFSLTYWDSDRVNIKADEKSLYPGIGMSRDEENLLSYIYRGPFSYTVVDDNTGAYEFLTEDMALEHQYLLVDGKLKGAVYSFSFLNQEEFEEFFNRVFYNLDTVYPIGDEDIATYAEGFFITGYRGFISIVGHFEKLTLYVVFIHPRITDEEYDSFEPYLSDLSMASYELLNGK